MGPGHDREYWHPSNNSSSTIYRIWTWRKYSWESKRQINRDRRRYSTFTTADIANLQKSVGDLTSEFSNINTKIDGLGQRARQADGGIAAAMALGGTMLLPDTSVSVSFNLATYRGEQGFSGSVVARVRENVWISGGIGGSTVKRSTGGRVGVSFGW
jgi:trimeric autotransporter adhesin